MSKKPNKLRANQFYRISKTILLSQLTKVKVIIQDLISLLYILSLDACKVPFYISAIKFLHNLNCHNLHIPYPL